MSNFRHNLPVDIPWTLIDCSPDMMDVSYCNQQFPANFRSSIAIYAYEPKAEELPPELCGKRITYLKVSCSITGYQPTKEEIQQVVLLLDQIMEPGDEVDPARLEAITRPYFGCYGVLLNVAVFPFDKAYADQLDKYPHIIDFEPKVRDFYQAATEYGEVLTTSFNKVTTNKSYASTDSTQSSWKGGANVTIPVEGVTVGLNGETGQTRTETDQENWGIQSDASRERREGQSTTTQLSQMYNLLTGYHAGTNRATFLMLPRPHVLQPTDYRTFVQGLRMIEGMQDFFLIVVRSGEEDRMQVEVQLQTGHFPEHTEIVETVPVEDQYETRSETIGPFTKNCHPMSAVEGTVGAIANGLGGDAPFNLTKVTDGQLTYTGYEVDGWEFDTTKGDAGHRAIEEVTLNADTIDDFENMAFEKHVYSRESPDKVYIDIAVKNFNMWPAKSPKFSREYKVYLRRKKNIPGGSAANTAGMLITQRGLCAAIEFGECLRRWSLDFDYDMVDFPIRDEPEIVVDYPYGYAWSKALVRKIQAALAASSQSPLRYQPGQVSYLQSRQFQKQLAAVLPKRVLERPVKDLPGIEDEFKGRLPESLRLKELLVQPAEIMARKLQITPAEVRRLKAEMFARPPKK